MKTESEGKMRFKSIDHLIKVYERFRIRSLKLPRRKRQAYKRKLDQLAERFIMEEYDPSQEDVESRQACSLNWESILSGDANLCGSYSSCSPS